MLPDAGKSQQISEVPTTVKNQGLVEKRREQIVLAAIKLFSRFGARRVPVEEICREAGVSKMTFYKYFPNKVGLVRTIRDRWVEEGFRKFDEIDALDLPFPEKVERMTRWKVEFAARVSADFIAELVGLDDVMEEVRRRYLANIAAAQKKGEIRSDIDPRFLWTVVEKLGELTREGTWKSASEDYAFFQRQMRILLFYGLLVRKEEK